MVENALRPFEVKLNVTTGSLPACWSKFCSGFLMSVPESAGLSWMTHQRSGGLGLGLALVGAGFSSRITRIPVGTSSTWARERSAGVSAALASASDSKACPLASGLWETLSNAQIVGLVAASLFVSSCALHLAPRWTAW